MNCSDYLNDHQTKGNKICHAIGIPLIVSSLVLFPFKRKTAVKLFITGWAFQIIGHKVFEKNNPSFIKEPKSLVYGIWYWIENLIKHQ